MIVFASYISNGFSNIIEASRKSKSFILSDYKEVELKARLSRSY